MKRHRYIQESDDLRWSAITVLCTRHGPGQVERAGVWFEGDWLPLAGRAVAEAKAMLKDSWDIPYFADAIVNGRQVPMSHVLRFGDGLVFRQRFGIKAGDDRPIERAIGEAVVAAYPDLLEKAARVRARNLSANHEQEAIKGVVDEWAVQQFGQADASTKAILADIVQRLQRIETVLGRGDSTVGEAGLAVAGVLHGEVISDGPQPPDRFRLFGKEYKGISRDQWRLLEALWPKQTAEIDDVMEQVYGVHFKQEQEALRSLARRLTECLVLQSCPAEIVIKNGYCTLEIYHDRQRSQSTEGRPADNQEGSVSWGS